MANINTTATMKKTSAMLSGKCKKTQENLKKLMADAGCADGEVVKVCEMPAAVVEILKNCGEM